MQDSIQFWENLLTTSSTTITPIHHIHGQSSAMYPYTVEVRWNSALEEQVLYDDLALLTVESKKLEAHIKMLEQHIQCLPTHSAAGAGGRLPSALALTRDIDSQLRRMVQSREEILRGLQDVTTREVTAPISSTIKDLSLRHRETLTDALNRIGRLPEEIERVTALLALYASTTPCLWQFEAVEGLLREAKACCECLEEQYQFSVKIQEVNALSSRLVTAMGM